MEVPVIPEPRQRVGQCQPYRAQGSQQLPLVELDREQGACDCEGQQRRPLPEAYQRQRGGAHQRERQDRLADARDDLPVPGAARRASDDRCDQEHVHEVAGKRRDDDARRHQCGRVVADRGDHEPCARPRQRERGRVVRDPDRGPAIEEVHDRRSRRDDEHPGGPTEQNDSREPEHERQRDAVRVEVVDRHGETVGEDRGAEEGRKTGEDRRAVRCAGERDGGGEDGGQTGQADRGDDGDEVPTGGSGSAHRLTVTTRGNWRDRPSPTRPRTRATPTRSAEGEDSASTAASRPPSLLGGRRDCHSPGRTGHHPDGGDRVSGALQVVRPASASGRRAHAKRALYQPLSGASATPYPDEWMNQPSPR